MLIVQSHGLHATAQPGSVVPFGAAPGWDNRLTTSTTVHLTAFVAALVFAFLVPLGDLHAHRVAQTPLNVFMQQSCPPLGLPTHTHTPPFVHTRDHLQSTAGDHPLLNKTAMQTNTTEYVSRPAGLFLPLSCCW